MVSMYPACFYKEKEGGYSVIFPVLNIATCGDTLDEAMRMAADCLAGYLHSAEHDNEKVPAPPSADSIDINAEYDGYESAFVNTVAVDVEEYAREYFGETAKMTLTVPARLKDMAAEKEINVSRVLERALREELHIC